MKRKILFLSLIVLGILLYPKDTYAFSSANYEYKSLCGNFEVAGMHTDGVIDPVACFNSFDEAKNFMKSNGADDLVVFGKVAGKTKILDANVALLDLSVNPTALTYFYTNSNLTGSSYTYMDTGSLYGGVDGALLDSSYSNVKGVYTAKVKIGNFTGWISQEAYEVVPITWVKSSSSYTVTNESIKHNYVNKIQETFTGSKGSIIGPKPEMLSPGTYYSYDGKYFYTDRTTMIKDYKNGNYNNAVNKNNEYYNYYMYLSNHTRTSYSSQNIDEYIRNNMGISQDVYGNASNGSNSRLYGKGIFYYYAQEKYGVNAILSLSLSRNETSHGRSNLAINKNNGFGLNAVDSSPTESANWYASYASSILGYASKWITYGYAHPRDWRYFGPQFGDKWIGMNVKYASDTYWSEKMAAQYYSLDKAKGLQDYNFYQLGVVTRQVNAMSDANNSSKFVYSYPEAEDAVVIVGEKQGEAVEGNATWYKVVSDLNIDSNFNEITSGDYNWVGYVYIPAAYVKKINRGKNGYISPNEVTEYQDKDYEYDLYVEETTLKPKVAKTVKQTEYYYDSALTVKRDQVLLNNRYVMVYTAAYDKNGVPVSYLVTSDYWYDQKHWIPADSISFISSDYGKFSVTAAGNQYTWVNSKPEDTKATLISGHYHNSYAPILEETVVDGYTWYKVPVNLSGTANEFGWTLASAPNVYVEKLHSESVNTPPVIVAENKTIVQGTKFDYRKDVSATDPEDGDLTKEIEIVEETVKVDEVGTYEVTYKVTDKNNITTTKTITVTVTENKKPVITAEDKEVIQGRKLDELEGVSATDEEDGQVEVRVKESTVNLEEPGRYTITYEATDSYKQRAEKTITVTVIKDEAPIINAEDKTITQGTKFNPLEGVTAEDKEDGEIKEIEVVTNDVKENKTGEYEVTYKVVDSFNNETKKTINVTVVENQKPVINAEDKTIYLNEEFDPLEDVTAIDPEDGKIKDIEVIENNVKIEEVGEYKVIYQVEDSFGNVVTKEITVTVEEKRLEEREGLYYFDSLKEVKNKLQIKGYHAIKGLDHTLEEEITFYLVLKNLTTEEEFTQELNRITDKEEITRPVFSNDGKDYTYSWYKGNIDIDELPDGDYELYIVTESHDYYARTRINNKVLKDQVAEFTSEKTVTTRNDYRNPEMPLQFVIRSKKIADKTADSVYNQYTQYRTFTVEDNKLHIKGTAYSIGMNLAESEKVNRQIIFENQENYKTYSYDLGSITDGMYKVGATLNDGLDKTRAWFDSTIDISNIPKGTYTIYIATKSNVSDYSELTELLSRNLDDVVLNIDGKTYSFTIDTNERYRIEMNVE